MKGGKLIIGGLLVISILCSQKVWAKKFNLSGSGALSVTQTNINNKTIKDIPPDLTIGLEYMVNGRFQNLDINSSIELKFNSRDDDWDEMVKSFTFDISNPRTKLNIGDLYYDISDFTLSDDTNLQFGLKLDQDIKFGEKTEIVLIGGRLQEASIYETDKNENGILDPDDDLNGNGKWDYGYSYYDQWLGGIRLSSSPTKNTFLGMTYLKINDDRNSIEQKTGTGITLPIKNDVFSVDSAVSFYNHFLIILGEISRSKYEKVGSLTDHDKAYKFSLKADKKNWNFELGYNYIGSEYYSAGNSYLNTDKKGYFTSAQWLPNEIFSIILEGEVFEDNLLKSPEYPITDTKIITTTFEVKPKNYPQITIACKLTDEKSDKYTTLYPKLDKLTTDASLEICHSIKTLDYSLRLQHTNTNDKSTDTSDIDYEDYKSDVISLNLDTKFAKKFTLSNYISYTKNKTGDDKNDTFNTTIDLIYDIIPQKLIFKPGYEFEEYRVDNKNVGKYCSSKKFTGELELDYYRSPTSQISFIYERKESKNLEDSSIDYCADMGTIKYTQIF